MFTVCFTGPTINIYVLAELNCKEMIHVRLWEVLSVHITEYCWQCNETKHHVYRKYYQVETWRKIPGLVLNLEAKVNCSLQQIPERKSQIYFNRVNSVVWVIDRKKVAHDFVTVETFQSYAIFRRHHHYSIPPDQILATLETVTCCLQT